MCASQKLLKHFESAAVSLSHSVSTNRTALTAAAAAAIQKDRSDTLQQHNGVSFTMPLSLSHRVTATVITAITAAAAAKTATASEAYVMMMNMRKDDRKEQNETVTE